MTLLEMKDYILKTIYDYDLIHCNKHQYEVYVKTYFDVKLSISFPGYKTNRDKVDFLVKLGGLRKVSHEEIFNDLYNLVCKNNELFKGVESFLMDISYYWENIDIKKYSFLNFDNFRLEELIECICYISIQEEINYPSEKGFDGYKRPFYSYLEAIYSANNPNTISYDIARERLLSNKRINLNIFDIPYDLIK